MRRSAAPSTLCGGKRMRFTSPLLSLNRNSSPPQLLLRGHEEIQNILLATYSPPSSFPSTDGCISGQFSPNIVYPHVSTTRQCSPKLFKPPQKAPSLEAANPLQSLENTTMQSPALPVKLPKKMFTPKFVAKSAISNQLLPSDLSVTNSSIGVESKKYFEAMWTKFSKKKHKTWEGDGILIVSTTSYELRDHDNKLIGKRGQCKASDLSGICDGVTLSLGGKEVLVCEPLSPETTQIFCQQENVSECPKSTTANKTFMCPSKASQSHPAINHIPRHDPSAPGSIVLEGRRSDEVAVVIDPYIAYQLRPHQVDGVKFLYSCVMGFKGEGCGAVLADEMGLGKTLQCITLIWTLLKQGPEGTPLCRRALVVTPSSLVNNWKKEFKKWLGDERIRVWALTAGESQISDFIKSPLHSILVISYEMFRKGVKEALTVAWGLLVCDEGHRLKNTNAKITEALSQLPCKRRVILSGTPVQNNLKEFYTLVNFVNPGVLGSSSTFKKVYADPIQLSQLPSANSNEKFLGKARSIELNNLTSQFILRRTSELNEKYLPPKREFVVFCAPHPIQVAVYTTLLEDITAERHLELICKLKKVCNHPRLISEDSGGEIVKVNESGKLAVTAQLLQNCNRRGEKVVLVSNYTQTLNLLAHLCNTLSLTYHRLDGTTPTSKRNSIVEQFNSKHDSRLVFLLSSKAGGVGLNLIGGSSLILYDIDWNPANDQQVMARLWRDGQKRTVHIYRLITTGTIEEKIFQRQVRKWGLSSVVVEGISEECSFSEDELRDIFTLNTSTLCNTHDILQCGCGGQYRYTKAEPSLLKKEMRSYADPSDQMLELMRWSHSHHLEHLEDAACVTFVLHRNTNT